MKYIALALMVVGLCFYELYRYVWVSKMMVTDAMVDGDQRYDGFAATIAVIAAITLILG